MAGTREAQDISQASKEQTGARSPCRGQRRTVSHRPWGQQRDVKHEWNKVKGKRLERKQDNSSRSHGAPCLTRQTPKLRQLPAPVLGFSVAPAGSGGILVEVAKPHRWGKAVIGTWLGGKLIRNSGCLLLLIQAGSSDLQGPGSV